MTPLAMPAVAQVVPRGTTSTYTAPNGVPVVDIATPNSSGLSHNKYDQFNVPSQGMVLNNSGVVAQSGLAGYIRKNQNISGGAAGATVVVGGTAYTRGTDVQASGPSATLILNEVVSAKRSALNGYTEVNGPAASVVIANPYGITCNGCGFINAPRVTLSTGVPTVVNGALTGFQVGQGDILITGNGLDGRAQDVFDLVARRLVFAGQVNARDLTATAGANAWSYAGRAVTGAATATETTPTYAIDSTVFGGMYANRIRLSLSVTSGTVRGGTTTTIAASSLGNAGTIQGGTGLSLTATTILNNIVGTTGGTIT